MCYAVVMDDDRAVIELTTRGDGDQAIVHIVRFFRTRQLLGLKTPSEFFCDRKLVAQVSPRFELFSAVSSSDLMQFEPRYDERLRKIFGEIDRDPERVYPEIRTTLEVSRIYLDEFLRLLMFLRHLGNVGSSRGIDVRIDPEQKPILLCGWDGDGADQMPVLTVDGEEAMRTGRGYGFDSLTANRIVRRYRASGVSSRE